MWYEASGDSWVVDARDVLGAFGAASYLTKYLVKDVEWFEGLRKLGFGRRYSRSRSWAFKNSVLLGTSLGLWKRVSYVRKAFEREREVKESETSWLVERVGTDISKLIRRRTERRRVLGILGRYWNGNFQASDVLADSGSGD